MGRKDAKAAVYSPPTALPVRDTLIRRDEAVFDSYERFAIWVQRVRDGPAPRDPSHAVRFIRETTNTTTQGEPYGLDGRFDRPEGSSCEAHITVTKNSVLTPTLDVPPVFEPYFRFTFTSWPSDESVGLTGIAAWALATWEQLPGFLYGNGYTESAQRQLDEQLYAKTVGARLRHDDSPACLSCRAKLSAATATLPHQLRQQYVAYVTDILATRPTGLAGAGDGIVALAYAAHALAGDEPGAHHGSRIANRVAMLLHHRARSDWPKFDEFVRFICTYPGAAAYSNDCCVASAFAHSTWSTHYANHDFFVNREDKEFSLPYTAAYKWVAGEPPVYKVRLQPDGSFRDTETGRVLPLMWRPDPWHLILGPSPFRNLEVQCQATQPQTRREMATVGPVDNQPNTDKWVYAGEPESPFQMFSDFIEMVGPNLGCPMPGAAKLLSSMPAEYGGTVRRLDTHHLVEVPPEAFIPNQFSDPQLLMDDPMPAGYYDPPEDEPHGGHPAPLWTCRRCGRIGLSCTCPYDPHSAPAGAE